MPGLVLVCGVLAAGQATPAAKPNDACLVCHKEEAVLSTSSHKSLTCLECHSTSPVGGTPERPHQKDVPTVDCARSCHRQEAGKASGLSPSAYADSVHGRSYLERGSLDVAKCWDCHGKHNILPAKNPDSTVNRRNIPLICSTCHADMAVVVKYHIHAESPYQEYLKSVHGQALYKKGLLDFSAVCTDCHGAHDIQGAGTPHLKAKDPATCGRCHVLILEEYEQSVHGRAALEGNVDAPLCVDCHGEHSVTSPLEPEARTAKTHIPDTCSACHARPEIMVKYGIPEDRIRTFIGSLHGIAIGLGDKAAASCASCHGVHDIRPAADPASRVNPRNLVKTCGQVDCHPGMPEKIATAKIHLDLGRRTSGAPYYVQKLLLWAVLLAAAATAVWFFFALKRRLAGKKTSS
ncbi:MAG: cytochrome c3 family protein [Candidatus Aminicenantes bacterium]|nr:cytochrome c3 family protein [Candidatus Aminicenantes bacterium]